MRNEYRKYGGFIYFIYKNPMKSFRWNQGIWERYLMIIKYGRMINDEDWKTFAAKFSIELNLIWIDNINLKYYSFLLFVCSVNFTPPLPPGEGGSKIYGTFVYWFNKK